MVDFFVMVAVWAERTLKGVNWPRTVRLRARVGVPVVPERT